MKTRILPALLPLALLVPACGDDSPSGSDSASASSTGSGTDASTSGGSSGGSSSEGTGTTSALDPCLACDANSDCSADGDCTCKDGFSGDGKSCADVDECESGQNSCDADATCTNEPGSYTCKCNDGYKGNGMSCKDIDECSEGSHQCDPNATCTNNDGGYACKCNDGFSGDGFSCSGGKAYGEPCAEGIECASGICLLGMFNHCSQLCDFDKANDCRDQGAKGLCLPVDNNQFVCAGTIETGADKDDEIVKNGTVLTRFFDKIGDVDIFRLDLPMGMYTVFLTPEPDDDAKIDFYDLEGKQLGTINEGGAGYEEGANYTANGYPIYMVVTNVGNTTGQYKLAVQAQ
ncbi:MAG TPA: calcium-binding EGF-like domain-containing protein [Nannocystaceae bacterium]|nr:calcium-binding EGF-like domain-containing protein [Nannocystaceae bacterium]